MLLGKNLRNVCNRLPNNTASHPRRQESLHHLVLLTSAVETLSLNRPKASLCYILWTCRSSERSGNSGFTHAHCDTCWRIAYLRQRRNFRYFVHPLELILNGSACITRLQRVTRDTGLPRAMLWLVPQHRCKLFNHSSSLYTAGHCSQKGHGCRFSLRFFIYKGGFTHSMPCPCRSPAMPCR
jgi:hypothetical protein